MATFPSVAHSRVVDNAATTSLTLANNWAQSAGNLWLIMMNWDNGVTLNSGNGPTSPGLSFYKIFASHTFSASEAEIWYTPRVPAVASGAITITMTMSGSCACELYIADISPPDNNGLLIDFAPPLFTTQTGVTTSTCGPMVTTFANELLVGYEIDASVAATGAGTGWTADSASPSGFGTMFETQTQATKGTSVTATTVLSGSATGCTQGLFGIAPALPPNDRRTPRRVAYSFQGRSIVTPSTPYIQLVNLQPSAAQSTPPNFTIDEEIAAYQAPIVDQGPIVNASVYAEDVAVSPLLIDDVGPPLPPPFDDGRYALASGDESIVAPLHVDDVGVPLPPIFDPGIPILATPEEPNVVPLLIDDVGVPLPPIFDDGRALLASPEEPMVLPLTVDETGPAPRVWPSDTTISMAGVDEFSAPATTVALDDVGTQWSPPFGDGRHVIASPEEPMVVPLQIDEAGTATAAWWSDGFGSLASGDEVLVSTPALEDVGAYQQPWSSDWIRPSTFFDEPALPTPVNDDAPVPPPLWPDAPLRLLLNFDDLPLLFLPDEPSPLPLPLHPDPAWLSLVSVPSESVPLQLAYVYLSPSAVLVPVLPPSLAVRPYLSPSSVLVPSLPASVISPPKRWP